MTRTVSIPAAEFDEQMMRRAIRLAMNGRGGVEPNPMVGCVIVKDGHVIGEGYHAQYGGLHAEPAALAACSESPAGATAYVTLEPCSHANKKTPPCAPKLIEAQIGRVVVGCLDPNPDVNGKGLAMLRAAAIEVGGPVLEASAKQLIAPFIATVHHQRPYVTLKWAQSANGKVAGTMGRSVRITNEASDAVVHGLRARCDAIIVGTNTVLKDDPLLTARGVENARQLTRVILSNSLKISPTSKLVATAGEHPLVVYSSEASVGANGQVVAALRNAGAEVVPLPDQDGGRFSFADVLRDLHARGVVHALVEPGPTLTRYMFARGQADRVWVFQSPRTIDEPSAPSAPEVTYPETARTDVAGDTLIEYLSPKSAVFFSPESSADFVMAKGARMTPALADRLPYDSPPLPERWRWARPAAYVAIALLFLALVYQFHRGTTKQLRKAAEAREAGATEPVKQHKGAIGRWRFDVQQFWRGQNIYLAPLPPGREQKRSNDAWQAKHPNMPVVVVMLTPFGYMSAPAAALVWNVLKLAALVATVLMTVAVVSHDGRRMPDWLVLLGFLAAANFLVADFQHGNTNLFVAAAVVGHCYAQRRGRDVLAGVLLALAICLKMTPALFVLYWLWQREGKVLASTFVALAAMILSPALFTGWSFYAECMATWWTQTIAPGLSGTQWYPASINQSLPGMIARYFLGGDNGNFLWEPDDEPVPTKFGWITVIDLGPVAAKRLLQVLQAIIVVTSFWAMGLRKLPRDDGRRALHYGLIVSMMMLLNQRTWEHHAAPLIVAHLALVYAACHAAAPKRWRNGIGYALLAAVVLALLSGDDPMKALFGEAGSDRAAAYGTTFWHFLIVWVLCVIAARRLRDLSAPYEDPVAEATSPNERAGVAPTT